MSGESTRPKACLHCLVMAYISRIANAPDFAKGDLLQAIDQLAGAVEEIFSLCDDAGAEKTARHYFDLALADWRARMAALGAVTAPPAATKH